MSLHVSLISHISLAKHLAFTEKEFLEFGARKARVNKVLSVDVLAVKSANLRA